MLGVLLDLDGTLVDSNEAHARAWMEALAEAGVPVEYEAVRAKIGEGGDKLLPELTGISHDSALGKKIRERRSEIFRLDYLPRLRAMPGAHALLKLFRERGLRYVAATSSSRQDVELLLKQANLDGLITELATADDVSDSKPGPDLIFAALDRIGLPPHEVMMLGDTPYDIAAAAKAGVSTVAFTCGGWSRDQLAGAVAVYQGPWELLAAFEHSPFVRARSAA
ncbi:MAG TPA: HAD family hydrolase [Bdellovibrionota bacterium]|jgi:phosphoglycolate phosphatase-like HAD superfamily hydrolase